MNENNSMLQSIYDGIKYLIDKAISKAPFTRMPTGSVLSVDGNGKYTVSMGGRTYNGLTSIHNTTLTVGQTVRVVIPLNNMSDMFILN